MAVKALTQPSGCFEVIIVVDHTDIIKTGLWTYWYENGQKRLEETYKDGEKHGKWTSWYENGQKRLEETFKDGEMDGKWTKWYMNGQKSQEDTYKDGRRITKKCWDWNGNELEWE